MLKKNEEYRIHHGDCIPYMGTMPDASVDMAVFSPPFPSVFAYTSSPSDLGNSDDVAGEAKLHLSFFYHQFARIVKPGRVIMVHVQQISRLKRSGEAGMFDFRGMNIRLGQRAGLVYDYDWCIRKNPQAQAIRTKKWELKFQGLESDRAQSRGALPDFLIKFRAPGENKVPVDSEGEVNRNDWIEWAECTWRDIKETGTLNKDEGRGEEDTKHIAPLQLEVIHRLVKLYTNPGEIVFSPFAGIGSEGYVALKNGRKFIGAELKDEYHAAALVNMERAISKRKEESKTLFDSLQEAAP